MLKFDTHTWSFQLYRRHSTIQRVEYHGKAVIHTSYFIFRINLALVYCVPEAASSRGQCRTETLHYYVCIARRLPNSS